MSEARVSLAYVENLRSSDPTTISALIADVLRQHIERVHPACIADLYALSELSLPGGLKADLLNWSSRATREIADLPDGEGRKIFVAGVAEVLPARVPKSLREAILGLMGSSGGDTAGFLEDLARIWEATPPEVVTLPVKKVTKLPAMTAGGDIIQRKVAGAPKKAAAAKTPAALVDPARGLWVRDDVVSRLQPYERGLKETVLVSTTVHRSPYKDMTEAEVKTELRKLERERKLKHTGDRWMMR